MTDSIDTSEREAEEPRMLRLPVVEMSAEPAPPPVAAGYEPHPVGTGERIRFLERMNAELVEALRFYANPGDYKAPFTGGLGKLWHDCGETARAALTSATKEQKK